MSRLSIKNNLSRNQMKSSDTLRSVSAPSNPLQGSINYAKNPKTTTRRYKLKSNQPVKNSSHVPPLPKLVRRHTIHKIETSVPPIFSQGYGVEIRRNKERVVANIDMNKLFGNSSFKPPPRKVGTPSLISFKSTHSSIQSPTQGLGSRLLPPIRMGGGDNDPEDQYRIQELEETVTELNKQLRFASQEHYKLIDEMKKEAEENTQKIHIKYKSEIEKLENENLEKLNSTRKDFINQIQDVRKKNTKEINLLQREIQIGKDQHDKYRTEQKELLLTQLQIKEDELNKLHTERLNYELNLLREELTQEKEVELTIMSVEYETKFKNLLNEREKEIQNSIEQSNKDAQNSNEKLGDAKTKIDEFALDNKNLITQLKQLTSTLESTQEELKDAKMNLLDFEKNFSEKISKVEEKFGQELENLRIANAKITFKHIQKCEDFYQILSERDLREKARYLTAKERLHTLIKARAAADISVAMSNKSELITMKKSSPRPLNTGASEATITAEEEKLSHSVDIDRPSSSPQTKREIYDARTTIQNAIENEV